MPKMPVGIYDFKGQKLTDVTTDVSRLAVKVANIGVQVFCSALTVPLFATSKPNGYFELLVPASRNNANAPSGSGIMAGLWCMTANDPGTRANPSTTSPKKNYRSITACFEALPGRIVPVDLAPVTITAPVATSNGGIVDVPCDLPPEKPELFNVAGDGPICYTTPCELEIRGRNFGATPPSVRLLVPSEQETGPYANPTTITIPNVTVGNYDTTNPTYNSVSASLGF